MILFKYFVRICEVNRKSVFSPTSEQRTKTQEACSRLVKEMRERVPLLNSDSMRF